MSSLQQMLDKAKVVADKNAYMKDRTLHKKTTRNPAMNIKAVEALESAGFSINRFEVPKKMGCDIEVKGQYYCQYGNWIFLAREIEDISTKGEILAINDLRNIKTGEKISFFCDLYCNNTSDERLRKIILVMDLGLDKFMEEEYGYYMQIPQYLRNMGYSIDVNNFEFDIHGNAGNIEINNMCYIRIYNGWNDKMKFVVTNNPNWDANSYNGYWGDKAYFFEYSGREDLMELCKCIDAFVEEMQGEYGYFENGRYYNNEYLDDLVECVRKQLHIHYQHKLDQGEGNIEDQDLKWENKRQINHYEGLDIYKVFEISFGGGKEYRQEYKFLFEYDKKKDSRHCTLLIESVIYKNGKEYDHQTCELKGSFQTLFKKLKEFVWEIYDIQGIKIK